MSKPQLENGYTRIANEILEAIAKAKLNGSQFRILMIIWRYTYGFHKKEHEMSETFIAEATGITKRQVRRELKTLVDNKIIIITKEATFTEARKLKFNKNYKEWGLFNLQDTKKTPEDKLDLSPEDKLDLSPEDKLDPQKRKYKEKINKVVVEQQRQYFINECQKLFGTVDVNSVLTLAEYINKGMSAELLLQAVLKGKMKTKGHRSKTFDYALSVVSNWYAEGKKEISDLVDSKNDKENDSYIDNLFDVSSS
ncbi:replication protein [Caminicella sporogenes]|uniref:replication protein n=1 Tax=Caminicella sporogenes TaxID=166485 RepID=UPI002541EBFE|nr:replication protein [Caminicella sporogenes]WIF95157.1 replication protein [Caminicella sporogenes]